MEIRNLDLIDLKEYRNKIKSVLLTLQDHLIFDDECIELPNFLKYLVSYLKMDFSNNHRIVLIGNKNGLIINSIAVDCNNLIIFDPREMDRIDWCGDFYLLRRNDTTSKLYTLASIKIQELIEINISFE